MSVLLETSLGDIVVDLLADFAPQACENFLKLCKLKYYNYSPIHTVQPNFSLQTGDPIGPGSQGSDGGSSIWGLLPDAPPSKKLFRPEIHPKLKHAERGTISFATAPSARDPDEREAGSQFIITLGDDIDYLDGKAAIFGKVVEGFDVLEKINTAFIDNNGRPLKDIRIRHTVVLDEAEIPDPPGFTAPAASPLPTKAQLATVRIADDEDLKEETDPDALERLKRTREARAQALTLEMVGDLPFADAAPPENVLFVAKLNSVTQDEDLELIFSRFGTILSCEIIRDKRTGDSLNYAFIEFAERSSCEQAFFKMQGTLIDDHRIHVDFSQSVARTSADWVHNKHRKRSRGGFGGMDALEKRRQYRDDDDDVARRNKYGIVLDRRVDEDKRRDRRRSHSPPPKRRHGGDARERDHRHERGKDRDRDRYRRASSRSRSPHARSSRR